jgi:hypothetical protein
VPDPVVTNEQECGGRGWLKLVRSDLLDELLRDPPAWTLYTLIAVRARWRDGSSLHGLTRGQALVGDFAACGLTRRQYRDALARLVRWGIVTAKPTPRGTVATLVDDRVFALSPFNARSRAVARPSETGHLTGQQNGQHTEGENTAESPAFPPVSPDAATPDGQQNGQPSGHQTANTRPTPGQHPASKKKGRRGKNEKTERESGAPSLDEVLSLAREIGHDEADARKFHLRHAARGWTDANGQPIRDWRSSFNLWRERAREHAKEHPAAPTAAKSSARRVAAADKELRTHLHVNIATWRDGGKWLAGFNRDTLHARAVADYGPKAGPLVDAIIADLETAPAR